MKQRMLRTAAGAILAVVMVLPGAARPAHAIPPAAIAAVVSFASSAYSLIQGVFRPGASADDLSAGVRLIINAIETSKTEILARIDAIATAEASACARQAVIEFADIESFTPQTMQRWAQDATGCVTLISSLIGTVSTKSETDELGIALNTAGPIAIAARARAGFSIDSLKTIVAQGNRSLVTLLEPACSLTPLWGDQPPGSREVEVNVRCTVYPGVVSVGHIIVAGQRNKPLHVPFSAYEHIFTAASNQTSRAVALAALQIMPS